MASRTRTMEPLPESAVVRHLTAAENAQHMLVCLISYHERTHAGTLGQRDPYLGALKYSLSLVEKELEKERTGNT